MLSARYIAGSHVPDGDEHDSTDEERTRKRDRRTSRKRHQQATVRGFNGGGHRHVPVGSGSGCNRRWKSGDFFRQFQSRPEQQRAVVDIPGDERYGQRSVVGLGRQRLRDAGGSGQGRGHDRELRADIAGLAGVVPLPDWRRQWRRRHDVHVLPEHSVLYATGWQQFGIYSWPRLWRGIRWLFRKRGLVSAASRRDQGHSREPFGAV